VQHKILTWEYLPDNVPFAIGIELISNIPINNCGYADVYINNNSSLTVDLPGTENANRLEAAILLTIKVAAWLNNEHEHIPHKPMIAKDKLTVDGGLAETKIVLGWHFNFRTLTVTLPEHKHIAWSAKIQQMISTGRTLIKALESMIGQMRHVRFISHGCIIS
jgi:hypothetical protein